MKPPAPVTTENWGLPPHNRWSFQHVQELFPTCRLARGPSAALGLPTILIGLSQDLRVTRWNQMAGKVFGGVAAQTCGKRLEEAGIHWDWDRVRRGISACREEGVSIRVDDVSFVRTNGKDGVLGLTIHPLTRDGDVFLGFTIIGADITERKKAEAELARTKEVLETLLATAPPKATTMLPLPRWHR